MYVEESTGVRKKIVYPSKPIFSVYPYFFSLPPPPKYPKFSVRVNSNFERVNSNFGKNSEWKVMTNEISEG